MARYLLDTNICIYIRQRSSLEVAAHLARLKPGDAAMSVITYGELCLWIEKHSQREKALVKLAELNAIAAVLPLTPEVAEAYGSIRADLQARGEIIGGNDLWIAAHARSLKLTLVTNNEREFKRVRGLKLANWSR